MKTFDAIIIGSGQAGTPLAFKLADRGNKVAIIEKSHFGGTCVNTGCTPTKAYVASARRIWAINHAEELGIAHQPGATTDLSQVKARKDKLVQQSRQGISDGIENEKNISLFEGEAKFTAEKTVEVNGEELTADEIYINTGARAVIPDSFRQLDYLTNESILQLEELPKHLIIIGGSYIGLEFGQMFKRFGSHVTIIEKAPALIAHEDADVSDYILDLMKREGIEVRLNATCIAGKTNDDKTISVTLDCHEGEPEITGTHILLAVGRKPNTDGLNLQAAGIKTNEKGYIEVDDLLQTNINGIFALGDCNGKGAFTHTSYNDYEIIASNKFEDKKRKVSERITTYCLYIDPPLGRAGFTLKQARKKGYKILRAQKPMSQVARASEKGETEGFMTILVDAKTHKIIGASFLGTGGDEITSSILNIMYADVPYTVIRDSVIPHPTVAELIPTMLENLEEVT